MKEANPGMIRGKLGVAVMMAAISVFDGYDVFVPTYVIHYVRGPWKLTPAECGALVSSGLLGFMVGALATGFIADRIGRRPTLLAALMVVGLGNLATALFAHGLHTFVATRVVSGVGLGMIIPIVAAYLNELIPGRASNLTIVAASSGYTVGGVLAGIAGVVLTPSFGWAILFYIGGLSCVVALVLYRILPESPMFVRHAHEMPRGLLSSRNRRDSLVLWASAALALFNVYALSAWIPSVMMARGSGFSLGFLSGSVLQMAGLVGGFACAALSDRLGSRRKSLMIWYALLALSLAGLGATTRPALDIALVTAAGFFLVGAQPVFNNLAAQSYPTGLRAAGVGLTLGIGRIGAIAGPVVIGAVQSFGSGDFALFAVMACAAGATALVLSASNDRAIETDASTPTESLPHFQL